MSNPPDLMEAVGTCLTVGNNGGAGSSRDASQQSDCHSGSSKVANPRYVKLHSDVRPYAMMTRTCYMEYDPMKDHGEVPGIYARCIGPVIFRTIFFQDINLNQIQVAVERKNSKIYFTHGWSRMRDFYNIGPGAWLTLLLISPFVLHMKIRNIVGIEINYPLKNPPYRILLDRNFEAGPMNGPIPYFVLPKIFSHHLEKTLSTADVTTGSLTLFWKGFCQIALPNEHTQLTLIDWLGNIWKECDFKVGSNDPMTCIISGSWRQICNVHRLAKGVVVKFGVTQSSNNRTIYFKVSPFLGLRTTLYATPTDGSKKLFYLSQRYYML